MSNDIYSQLPDRNTRKVTRRTSDGFNSNSLTNLPTEKSQKHTANNAGVEIATKDIAADSPDYLVETAKSKLLTLEVSLRNKVDRVLFEHQDISWDTLIESALNTCLNNPQLKEKVIEEATGRLSDRKKTSVYRRTKTMSQKYS